MIEEIKKYTNEEGKGVTTYTSLEGVEPHKIRYEGTVGIRTPMGVQPIHFPFPDEYTLEKCFEDFETVADVEVKKIMEEAEKQHKEENLIVTPDQVKEQGGIVQFPGT